MTLSKFDHLKITFIYGSDKCSQLFFQQKYLQYISLSYKRVKMSYTPMHGSMSRTPYVSSEYDPNAYKIQAPQNYPQYQIQTQQPQPPLYPTQTGSTSVALFTIPSDGTNSLYVDGIPNDTTEREVSHIFRPFPGFQCIRLIKKTTPTGRQFFLCFVDFENVLQSTIAMNTLQDYRFDKNDKRGLKISYAKESKDVRQKSSKKYK